MPYPLNRSLPKGQFTTESYEKLAALGYSTLEAVIATAFVRPRELSRFLGFDATSELEKLFPQLFHELSARMKSKSTREFPLGVILDKIPPTPPELEKDHLPDELARNLPPSASLIPQLPIVRDQEQRGTCVAFSALSSYERVGNDFSEQFVYAICKQRDGIPNQPGTWLRIAYPVVRDVGVCTETTWPYVGDSIAGNEGQNPPPASAVSECSAYKRSFTQVDPKDISRFKAAIAEGQVISFSIPVFDSWYRNISVQETGDIIMPLPGEPVQGGHAMALVGYADDLAYPGGGRFELRNSWGEGWAWNSSLGSGYGTIPYQYIAGFGKEAFFF
jgi:C1A family cysteine protease